MDYRDDFVVVAMKICIEQSEFKCYNNNVSHCFIKETTYEN